MSQMGVSHSSYHKCNSHHLLVPFFCDVICNPSFSYQLPSRFWGQKNSKQRKKKKTTRSFFQLMEENALLSLVRNSRYLIWQTEISSLPLTLMLPVCTYTPRTWKFQLEKNIPACRWISTQCSSILEKNSQRYQQWSHFLRWLLY